MIENKNSSFDDIIIDGIKYDLFHADRTATVSLNQHIRHNVVIPEFVSYQGNNYSVTAIADMAFHACRVVKSITLPNTIKSIGTHAFGKCSSLENCIIPNSVEVIKDYAFCSCTSLHSLSIPQNVKKIFGLLQALSFYALPRPYGGTCHISYRYDLSHHNGDDARGFFKR